ncbi:prepilin-type N-terminal cleavage/methylation domain-containing protein [Pseudoalteromonas sp. T1lg23B]|uniref:prepilin-type N-terminal cleavage/methylation domain-containing protein n=1 Tax=Pseudoalteromonas sp. T1lg23B TaxID=2077097 RepID=UPI000CF6A788|nr:prepilin-type N-terminal cleavage/methylation domain-containing protein [Pseudoalteromonas sp. T1lg23B]
MKPFSFNHQQGMTLIEVLIASVILFISISAISYVSKAMMLNEMRLSRAAEHAFVFEYIQDEVSYRFEYEKQREGEYRFAGSTYFWQVEVLSEKPVMSELVVDGEGSAANGTMILYSTSVFSQLSPSPKKIAEFKSVYWREQ